MIWQCSCPLLRKKHCFHAIVCKHSFYICISSNKCKKLVRNNQAYSTWKLHIRWICSQVHCYTSASRKSSHAMIGFAVMWRRKSKMIERVGCLMKQSSHRLKFRSTRLLPTIVQVVCHLIQNIFLFHPELKRCDITLRQLKR